MMGPFLTNRGRFLDAWTLFGTTIRSAHSIGLHRHPKYLDPAPPTQRECSTRQTLWWWMLHMDQEYSMILGRPLGISGLGDCPPPQELTTDPKMLRFGDFVNRFTLLARQILSSDRLTNIKIDEFTDSLKDLLDTLPETLQFNETWLNENKEIPEWPLGTMAAVFYCKTHAYLILLNRQRIEKPLEQDFPHENLSMRTGPPSSIHPVNVPASYQSSPPSSSNASLRGRTLVLSSSQDLLTAFLFFHKRIPAAQITWNMGQQAFNSCMILLIDALETRELSRIGIVEQAYVVFMQLQKNGVHELASLAVDKVSLGLAQLGRMRGAPGAQVQKLPLRPLRSGVPGCDVEMQGMAGNEAGQRTRVMHDTVMGNTGMFLLEDLGLQSHVSEAFAPLTWTMGHDLRGKAPSLQTQVEQKQNHQQSGRTQLENLKPMIRREVLQDTRSSEQKREAPGSPGSAQVQFATFSTVLSEDHQPQGLTAPTSPPTSMHEQHHHEDSLALTKLRRLT
ncbi:hypothetical protein N0V90_005266 [Kalmusia sp. IMI 367209]|nr:hypothetical protein N0V90_005266 [Kalmusia sp. IMI 367209]